MIFVVIRFLFLKDVKCLKSFNMLKDQYIKLGFGLLVTITSRTLRPLILLAVRKRMAVGFPTGLQFQKCPNRVENLSSVLVKQSVYDANVQRLAYPAVISANANAAND